MLAVGAAGTVGPVRDMAVTGVPTAMTRFSSTVGGSMGVLGCRGTLGPVAVLGVMRWSRRVAVVVGGLGL